MISAECGFDGEDAKNRLFQFGPTIEVEITKLLPLEQAAGLAPLRGIRALVDTGAILCFIDDAIATKLGLLVVDRQILSGSNGQHEANVYLARVRIPSLNFILTGQFAGVQLLAGGQPHGVLLGRNMLSRMVMNYDGLNGKVTLTIPDASPPSTASATP